MSRGGLLASLCELSVTGGLLAYLCELSVTGWFVVFSDGGGEVAVIHTPATAAVPAPTAVASQCHSWQVGATAR